MSKITLLDGGMGQELVRRSSMPPAPLWSAEVMLKEPHLVRDVHADFIKAGAKVITLNSYSATPQRLDMHQGGNILSLLHEAAIRAAQDAIEMTEQEDVLIAACLPPLVASFRPETSPAHDVALSTYRQLVALQADVSDIFLCETMASLAEARAACMAAKELNKPVWVSFTISDDAPGTLRSGEPLSEGVALVESLGADAVLMNCSRPETVSESWDAFDAASIQTGAYANAFSSIDPLKPGGTVDCLETRHDLSPAHYADHVMHWLERGASIVGGCCEVGPEHIQLLHDRLVA